MTIRTLLYSLGFLLSGAPAALAAPLAQELRPPTVGVILKFDRRPGASFVKQLREDIATIFRPTGLDLHWEVVGAGRQPGAYDRVVMLEMRGSCSALHPLDVGPTGEGNEPLGWTLINDGEVIPYAIVDCDRMARVLSQSQAGMSNRLAISAFYSRLASRVAAHELIHILLRTADHHDGDCTRSTLRPIDLARPVRLRPDEVAALRQIGKPTGTALAQRP